MTAARRPAPQSAPAPLRMVRVTVRTVTPLTIELPGGAIVAGLPVDGLHYTVDGPATALIQEPAVGPVFPTLV